MPTIIILAVIAIIILFALGIGYYLLSSNGNLLGSVSNLASTSIQSTPPLVLQGNYENQSVSVTNQTGVTMQGDYNDYNVSIDTNSTITLLIQGNDNNVNLINGRINLEIQGDSNVVHTRGTVILSRQIQGNTDNVI